jgi:hypothetical protein
MDGIGRRDNNEGKREMKIYLVSKKDVDSGQFPISSLIAYSLYAGVKIIISRFAEIENGRIEYFQIH